MKKIDFLKMALLTAVLLLGVQSAGAYGFKPWHYGQANNAFINVSTFYTDGYANTTDYQVRIFSGDSNLRGFDIFQKVVDGSNNEMQGNDIYGTGAGQKMYVGTCTPELGASTVVRATVRWTNLDYILPDGYETIMCNHTVILPDGKVFVTPTSGVQVEMTPAGSNTYTAIVPKASTVTVSGSAVTPSASGCENWMHSDGMPTSFQLNIPNVPVTGATTNLVKVTYDLTTNQVTFEDVVNTFCQVEISSIYGAGGNRGTAPENAALVSVETLTNGDITITLDPVNNNNPIFRGDGINGTYVNITIGGVPNTGGLLLSRSWVGNVVTLHPETPITPGTSIVFNNICFEYGTSLQGGLWPDLTFTYIYGTTCDGIPKVTTTPELLQFSPTVGVQTFTLEGENLTGPVTLIASKGLDVTPKIITPIGGIIDGETITVTWEEGASVGGFVEISGGGLLNPKKVTVTSSGFSEYCNRLLIPQDAASRAAYLTITLSTDKKVLTFLLEPIEEGQVVTFNNNGIGTVSAGGSTAVVTGNNTNQATATFTTELANTQTVTFGNPLVWGYRDPDTNAFLPGALNNCYINGTQTYTVGLGCDVATEDSEPPVIVDAELVSATSFNAIINVNATDNEGVYEILFEDTSKGISDLQMAKNDNGTANYTINGLSGNTEYNITVTAFDLIGNVSNSKMVKFNSAKTPAITPDPGTLSFTPQTGTQTFQFTASDLTSPINLTAPIGYAVTPATLIPDGSGAINETVTVKWLTGLGRGIVVDGADLKNPQLLVDFTSSGFNPFCNYILPGGTTPMSSQAAALMSITVNDDMDELSYKIAPYDVTGDAMWNGAGSTFPVKEVDPPNEDKFLINSVPTPATRWQASDRKEIKITFASSFAANDIIGYSSVGTTVVWTTTGYTNFLNNGNAFINGTWVSYTVPNANTAANCGCYPQLANLTMTGPISATTTSADVLVEVIPGAYPVESIEFDQIATTIITKSTKAVTHTLPYDSSNEYTLIGLTNKTEYEYEVTAIDTKGNRSAVGTLSFEINVPTGISTPSFNNEPVKTQYFTIDGREVAGPASGLYLVKKTYNDHSVITEKLFVK